MDLKISVIMRFQCISFVFLPGLNRVPEVWLQFTITPEQPQMNS